MKQARSQSALVVPWILLAPAGVFTLLFFVAPFLAMGLMSLWRLEGAGLDHTLALDNYRQFFGKAAAATDASLNYTYGQVFKDRNLVTFSMNSTF